MSRISKRAAFAHRAKVARQANAYQSMRRRAMSILREYGPIPRYLYPHRKAARLIALGSRHPTDRL